MPLSKRLALLRDSCRPRVLYQRLKRCDVHLYMVTFWGCMGFIGLGGSLLVFGPTLLDLADHLSVGIDALAIMFTCRAIGAAVGSVGSGIVLDKMVDYSYTIVSVIYISCIATTVILPLSTHIVMLGAFMFLNGVATGCIDNSTHAVLIRLWSDKAGPCMQILHFCFAFGAFIAPLITKPFVSEQGGNININSYDNISFTCAELDVLNDTNQTSMLDEVIVDNLTLCLEKINETCANLTEASVLITVTDGCVITYNTTDGTDSTYPKFGWAYWITSALFLPSMFAFIYFSITKELSKKCRSKKRTVVITVEKTKTEESKSEKKKSLTKQPVWYIVIMFALLFVFMLLYVGLEVAYGSLIFTVAVTGELNFTKPDAAVLTALFWGTFSFARLFSVVLAILKVRSSVMMAGNLSGSFLASLILVFYPHNPAGVWIGSAVLGASYASIYPTTMTWMSENTVATGKSTSVLVAAGTLGDISLPSIVGVIVAKASPDLLFYITFSGVIVSSVVVSILFLVACLFKRHVGKKTRHSRKRTNGVIRYEKLNEDTTSIATSRDDNDEPVNGDNTRVTFESVSSFSDDD